LLLLLLPVPTGHPLQVKRLIKALESARGNGTSMISLILPPKDQVSRHSYHHMHDMLKRKLQQQRQQQQGLHGCHVIPAAACTYKTNQQYHPRVLTSTIPPPLMAAVHADFARAEDAWR
jgi:peptide subunit release factor 1 (eRF1)